MWVSDLEKSLGITTYLTKTAGIGGRIKTSPEDFIVREILLNGSIASPGTQAWKKKRRGKHTICVLTKRSRDTFLTLEEIARRLGVPKERIGFGGIKDARALTAQYVSLMGVSPERIAGAHFHDMEIRPIGFAAKPLKPDQIWGNDFTIVIMGVTEDPKVVETRIAALTQELKEWGGVPNFFGHQRFGTVRPVTHLVGRKIAHRDFAGALMTFLGWSSPFEPSDSRIARERLRKTENFEEALQTFPRRLRFERSVLEYLHNHPKDYVGALRQLPLALRRLLLQAYQSYLFNLALSRRIELKTPLNRCEIGDCVVPVSNGIPSHRYWRVHREDLHAHNERIRKGRALLAIPLIGYKSPPSQGIQAEVEKHILAEEGVSRRSFYVGALEEVSARGGLRTALTPVRGLSMKLSLKGVESGKARIVLRFRLPRGSYATALVREIVKPHDPIAAGF
jgi:tRNA pseudouridine13 synthase